jgi:hypothetical protein
MIRLGGFGVLFVAGLGCGPTIEAGLANAPSARRSSPPRRQHDVIGNGPQSCGEGEPGERYREPRCPQQQDSADAGVATPDLARSGAPALP